MSAPDTTVIQLNFKSVHGGLFNIYATNVPEAKELVTAFRAELLQEIYDTEVAFSAAQALASTPAPAAQGSAPAPAAPTVPVAAAPPPAPPPAPLPPVAAAGACTACRGGTCPRACRRASRRRSRRRRRVPSCFIFFIFFCVKIKKNGGNGGEQPKQPKPKEPNQLAPLRDGRGV